MTYLFYMYDRAGRKRETVRVEAGSEAEAWSQISDYAYRHGYADYDRTVKQKGANNGER